MPLWTAQVADALWRNALGAVPLALLAACACRALPLRPATRHMIWLLVLLRFVCPFISSPLRSDSTQNESKASGELSLTEDRLESRSPNVVSDRLESWTPNLVDDRLESRSPNLVADRPESPFPSEVEPRFLSRSPNLADNRLEAQASRSTADKRGAPLSTHREAYLLLREPDGAVGVEAPRPSAQLDGDSELSTSATTEGADTSLARVLAEVLRLSRPWGTAYAESTPAGPCASDPLASTPEPGGGISTSDPSSYRAEDAVAYCDELTEQPLPTSQHSAVTEATAPHGSAPATARNESEAVDSGNSQRGGDNPASSTAWRVRQTVPPVATVDSDNPLGDISNATSTARRVRQIVPPGPAASLSPAVPPAALPAVGAVIPAAAPPVAGVEDELLQVPDRLAIGDAGEIASTEMTKAPPSETHQAQPAAASSSAAAVPSSVRQAKFPWREWIAPYAAMLVDGRDRLYALPRVPWAVWVSGTVLLAAAFLTRLAWAATLLRAARPGSADVQGRVDRSAAEVGLREAPRVYFVSRAISPMILCGRTPALLLPSTLWRELDAVGRQAVIFHELAHLKRRDHWVLWLEALVAGVFWWNPVVWWVRRRLRDEADLCCDAWVTWLMPQGRRVYAETLLATRRMMNSTESAVPGPGMAMLSGRARRLARRIKMIMTEQARPRLSAPGVVLGVVMALSAWIAAPASSCPPGEKEKGKSNDATAAPCTASELTVVAPSVQPPGASTVLFSTDRLVTPVGLPSTPAPPAAAAPPAPAMAPTPPYSRTVLAFPATPEPAAPLAAFRYVATDDDRRLEDRMRRLEEQMQRLQAQLEQLNANIGGKHQEAVEHMLHGALLRAQDVPSKVNVAEIVDHATAAALDAAATSGDLAKQTVRDALAKVYVESHMAGQAATAPIGSADAFVQGGVSAAAPGALVVRSYKLPKDKLEALVELMIRDDVPVRVRNAGDAIEVHATEDQHAVFAMFVAMIGDDEQQDRGYRLPKGKLEAVTEFMSRDDVPVTVSPGSDEITVHGSRLQQEVFSAFIRLIHPGGAVRGGGMSGVGAGGMSGGATGGMSGGGVGVAQPSTLKGTLRGGAGARATAPRASRNASDFDSVAADEARVWQAQQELEAAHTRNAKAAEDQARQAEENAARMEELRQRAAEEMEALESERSNVESRMKELQQNARELEREARNLDRQAEDLRRQAEDQRTLAERLENDDRREALEQARQLQREADEVSEKGVDLEHQAGALEREAEMLQSEVLALREKSRDKREALRSTR